MGLRAGRRTVVVLLVAATAAGTCYTAWVTSAGADEGRRHRPEIGTAVTLVRNADGSVTTISE